MKRGEAELSPDSSVQLDTALTRRRLGLMDDDDGWPASDGVVLCVQQQSEFIVGGGNFFGRIN